MNPNEEAMVRVLAERGMGWTILHEKFRPHCGCQMVYDQRGETLGARFIGAACGVTVHLERDRWNPFTSISDAFMLVDKLIATGMEFTLFTIRNNFFASFTKPEDRATPSQSDLNEADTACGAISLAVFAALEGKWKRGL